MRINVCVYLYHNTVVRSKNVITKERLFLSKKGYLTVITIDVWTCCTINKEMIVVTRCQHLISCLCPFNDYCT